MQTRDYAIVFPHREREKRTVRTLLRNPGVTTVVWHGKACLYVGHGEVARHFRERK